VAAELRRHRPAYLRALGFSVAINLLVLAPTLFMLEVYDRVVNSRNLTTLLMLLLAVIAAYVVMELLELVRSGLMQGVAHELDAALRLRLLGNLFGLRLRGQQVSAQVFVDLRTVRDFLGSPAVTALMDAPGSLFFLLLVAIISPWLGVMALVGALVQLVIALRTEQRTMPLLTEASRTAITAQNYARGTLRNAQVVEAMGMQGHLHRRWGDIQRKFLLLQAQASEQNGSNTATSRMVQLLQGSLLLGAACWLTLQGQMLGGGGMMIVASTLGARVLSPLTQLVAQWRTVVGVRDAITRLDAVLNAMPEIEPGMPLPAPQGVLQVEAVSAVAPGSTVPILRNVSFSLQPGEVLGVIGPSASGKTTLARLLVGIWPSVGGKVRLDGADVYAWSKDELGPHLGYLAQNVELFDGTLAANIARFGDIDMTQVRAATELVGLAPVIEALPDGYDSRIGDEGAFLSGGQRQRVGLARALYGNPQLLVLDEPNASLDEAGEQALMATLTQLKARGATVVVNTHRTNLLPAVDKLLVLRDGQVAAFGPRDEVLAALQKAAQPPAAPAAGGAAPTPSGGPARTVVGAGAAPPGPVRPAPQANTGGAT
jgi:ATP-binding cassette subfamily C exporter for protease/lipase